jgi:prevent-host-death family protein
MTMWNIAAAKQSFTQVIRDAQTAPQIISNRGKPVAAVIAIESLADVERARIAHPPRLTDLLAPLREAALEQHGDVDMPFGARTDRRNAFTELTNAQLP